MGIDISFRNTSKFEDKLREGTLSPEDLRALNAISPEVLNKVTTIRERGSAPNDATATINYLATQLENGNPLRIGPQSYLFTGFGGGEKPKAFNRLLAATAYVIAEEKSNAVSATNETVCVVGNEIHESKEAGLKRLDQMNLENPAPYTTCNYYFPNQVFANIGLENGNSLRIGNTRMLDGPSDFFGIIQTLSPDKEIVKSMEYFRYQSS